MVREIKTCVTLKNKPWILSTQLIKTSQGLSDIIQPCLRMLYFISIISVVLSFRPELYIPDKVNNCFGRVEFLFCFLFPFQQTTCHGTTSRGIPNVSYLLCWVLLYEFVSS